MERDEPEEKISSAVDQDVEIGNNTSDFVQSDEETQPCQLQDQDKVEWCKNKEPAVFPS